MAETVQQVLRERMHDDTVGLRHEGRVWTWREHLAEASAEAAALIGLADPARPLHVGALLGNTPAMLRAMAGAGLGGYVLCGINDTRRGAGLAADVRRAECQVLLVDQEHRPLTVGLDLDGVRVLDVSSPEWARLVADADAGALVPHREVEAMDTFMMIFTSGTSGDPKAVQVAHVMVLFAGLTLVDKFSITSDDCCYLSMPLFHSNAVLAGWTVAVHSGAAMAPGPLHGVAVPRRRAPLRRDVPQLRRQAAGLRARDAGEAGRRRQPAARGFRQRGRRPRHRGVRPPLRVRGRRRVRLHRDRDHHHPRARYAAGLGRAGARGRGRLRPRDGAGVRGRGLRRARRADQRRPGRRRAGQHHRAGLLLRLLQRPGGQRRPDAARDVLVRRPRLPRRRRLDLPRRPHRRLDARRRREPRRRPDRADPDAAARRSAGSRCTPCPTSRSATR